MTRARDIAAVFSTGVSTTELGYLDGVSSAIQTQINTKAADASQGIYLITPSSIANSGGTATLTGGAVSASAVTTVSLNGVFTDTYDNYRITIQGTNSVGDGLRIRFRASGTDATGNDYYNRYLELGATYVSSGGAATSGILGFIRTNRTLFTVDLGGIRTTAMKTFTALSQDSNGTTALLAATGQMGVASAYDGMTIYPTSGALTATIRVYGYKN